MRSVISLFTAAAILLHLVLGCCAHHSHGGEHHPATKNGTPVSVHSACCSHSHGKNESEQPDSPIPSDAPDEPCHEGSCEFLHTTPSAFEQDWLPTLLFVELPPRIAHVDVWSSCLQLLYSTPPPHPVRLTVLYRQLLI